jgi:hypothetical protein
MSKIKSVEEMSDAEKQEFLACSMLQVARTELGRVIAVFGSTVGGHVDADARQLFCKRLASNLASFYLGRESVAAENEYVAYGPSKADQPDCVKMHPGLYD